MAIFFIIIDVIIIIIPSWDNVDIATILFASFSLIAVLPATIVVAIAETMVTFFTISIFVAVVNRLSIQTPAVTKVDEWTNDDVGVGAAIAAGNHAEKGI